MSSTKQTQSTQESFLIGLGMLNPFAEEDPLDGEVSMGEVDEMKARKLIALLKSIDRGII